MDKEPLSTTRGILEATTKDPNLRFDTNLIKKYLNLGGTLSNNAIPQLESAVQPVSVLSSENASKKIPQMQDNLKSMTSPVQTSNQTTEPQKKDTSLTLINPETGQERIFYDADINKSQIQTLFNSGWTNSKGYVPSDIKLPEVNNTGTTGVKTVDRTEVDNAKAKVMNFDVSSDPMLKKILDITTSQWDSRIASLEKINKSRESLINQIGVRLGTQRYASLTAGGILSTEEKDSLDKITDYQTKKQQALIEAENAYKNQKWSEYVKQYEIAKTAYDDERKSVEELNKKVLEENKKITERDRIINIDTNISDLIANGKKSVLEIIDGLKDKGIEATSKEISDSLKNILPEQKDEKNLGTDYYLTEALKKQGILPSSASVFDLWKKEEEIKNSSNAKKVGLGGGTGNDYAQFSKENVALSVIPTQLKNSENEINRLLTGIRAGFNEGKTPYEVADNLMGYMISEKTPFTDGMRKYISLADLPGNKISELARLINAKQNDKAIALVENEIYKKIQQQQGDKFVSEADVSYVAEKVKEIQDLLGDGWTDSIGPFEGTFNQALFRFRTRDYQKIKTKINSITADLVNKRAGSALTDTEWNRLVADNIPLMTDKLGIFNDKLKELKGDPLTRLNTERSSFELPVINEEQLFNRNLRIPSYSSEEFKDPIDILEKNNLKNNPLGI